MKKGRGTSQLLDGHLLQENIPDLFGHSAPKVEMQVEIEEIGGKN